MKRRRVRFPGLAVVVLLAVWPLAAQERNALRGQALDARTGQPVFFAKIGVVGGDASAFTDLNGEFLVEDPGIRQTDTLVFSSMQYEATQVPVASLRQAAGVVWLGRRRNARNARLPFKTISPEALVRLVVDAAGQQYDRTAGTRKMTFREQVRAVQDGKEVFTASAQGSFGWYKSAYTAGGDPGGVGLPFTGQRDSLYSTLLGSYNTFLVTPRSYPLSRGSRVTNFSLNNPRYQRLFHGYNPCFYHPADLQELDAIRYAESFLNPKRVDQYRFYLLDYITLRGENLVVVGFSPKNVWVTKAYFTGRLFIKPDEKAIVRADFQLSPGEMVLFNFNSTIETLRRSYEVHYARQEEGWTFDSGSIQTTFSRRPRSSRFQSVIRFKADDHGAVEAADGQYMGNQPFVGQLSGTGSHHP